MAKDAKKTCGMCGKLKKAGMITKEGMKFCDVTCHAKFKAKKKVCEFC